VQSTERLKTNGEKQINKIKEKVIIKMQINRVKKRLQLY